MQKNVKGFIGLFSGLLSIVLVLVAVFVPLEPLKGLGVNWHGKVNVYIAVGAIVLAIVAIVFGILSRKDVDKKGPRKAGIIIGVIMVIISLIATGILAISYMMTDFINNGEESTLYQSAKDDPEQLKQLDEISQGIKDLRSESAAQNPTEAQ